MSAEVLVVVESDFSLDADEYWFSTPDYARQFARASDRCSNVRAHVIVPKEAPGRAEES